MRRRYGHCILPEGPLGRSWRTPSKISRAQFWAKNIWTHHGMSTACHSKPRQFSCKIDASRCAGVGSSAENESLPAPTCPNDLQHVGTLQKTAKSGHSHHENCLRQAVRIFCDLVQWIAAREHPKQRQQVTWSQAARSTAMSLAVEGYGTVLRQGVRCRDRSEQFHNVSHISQLSKMFQCFTSCLKSQAAAPMPPSQLRTFTLSDGDSLEPRVWDVGALPINAVSQSMAMASTKIGSCKHMGVSENSVSLNPMVNDHYPY